MIDDIRQFFANGPKRRQDMEALIGTALHKYLGPSGLPARLDAIGEVLNPVVGMEQASTASQQMMDPSRSLWDRVGAGGRMATEIAGVAAPMGAARVAGIGGDDAARAIEEALLGFSATPTAVAGKDFAMDEAGAFRAWHGSPHDFDQFSMDKIGTGEGAQAYGHGLYFAENDETAKMYQRQLRFPKSDGSTDLVAQVADDINYYNGNIDAARDSYRGMTESSNPAAQELGRAKLEALKEAETRYKGRLYEVEIDANPEDFLDWDAYIKDQPEIAKKLGYRTRTDLEISDEAKTIFKEYGTYDKMPPEAKARVDALQSELDMPSGELVGERAYLGARDDVDYLVGQMGRGGSASRAEQMRGAGIPGIRYLDAGSRSAGDGSRNYVVFDDKLVSIIKKYGIAGAAGMLGMSAQELQAQINQQQPAPLDGLPR